MKFLLSITILCSLIVSAHAQILSGTVKNADGTLLENTTLRLINTNYSSTTNKSGTFQFRRIPQGKYILEVTHFGYSTLNITVDVNGKLTNIDVSLSKSDRQLDEVVITAQKREESLQNVPASVSSLSANQIYNYRIWNLRDIGGIVPNLFASNPGDNRNVTSIRGIVNTSYDPAVTTYIDDVNQFSLDTYIPQLFDVERIEVLRGPQSTLYGRNAMGGVINVVTKQPSNTPEGFAEVDVAGYNTQRYSLGLRLPLISNKLFLGVAGLYNTFGGFYTNEYNGNKLDKQHSFLGNYYLKYLPTQTLSITLNVKNYANRNNGPFALAGSPDEALSKPFTANQNATTTMVDNIINTSLAINYKGRDFNFISSSAYQKNYRYYTTPIDGDFSPLDIVSIINNYGNKFNKVEVVTQEFRFSSPATLSPFKWTTGVYGFYKYSPTKQGTHYGSDAAVFNAPPNFTNINTNIERNYGTAVFGQLTYTIVPKLDLTAGIRYDHESKKTNVIGENQLDGESDLVRPDTSAKASFNAVTPKVSLLYSVTESSNLYAAFSRGFRAGGISQLSGDQVPLVPYQPEYSSNYELGFKNLFFDNKLRLNVSLFYTHVNNAQVPTLILPDAITVIKNTGILNSKGAELTLQANTWKWLSVDYNFGYTHARYKNLQVASNGTSVNYDNNRQIFTPDVTSMLAIQFMKPLSYKSEVRLILRPEWKLTGTQYFDLANNIKQNAYNQFNCRFGATSKYVDVFVWANNITNKHYIDYAYDFGATHLGNPRLYGVTLKRDF